MGIAKDVVGGIGDVIGTIIGGGAKEEAPAAPPPPAPAPVVEKQAVMPTADDDMVRKAKRVSLQQQSARRGRASTILTQDSDRLGG